ncbi:malonate transporter MadL subunit [Cytobacillus oceanisediminis]|jgi:malonate transporter MadL subunit|uniref:Malonate transporter MadL subunit n=1 Tax=Cytobacillus oceanisediminis TaxID=665099 RepID=A0A2V3A471_9BACI|nr:malonate transporter subunit MadL [Cytobacillus oceanisediminis]PWW28344.1 malonate transporter MadL subunit [Cytobacillus oceanisediminis]
MVIYGVALLSFCLLSGVFLGDFLGSILGIDANVGGVGIAMLLLILLVEYLKKKDKLNNQTREGLSFWSAMYIPIVIAMSAQQNVVAALDGGPLALTAGVAAVFISWAFVPLLSRGGNVKETLESGISGGDQRVRNIR